MARRRINKWLLRKLSEERGVSQSDLADASGMSRNQISRIFSGETMNPTDDTVGRMAEALGVTDSDVLWDTVPAFDLTQDEAKALVLLRKLTPDQSQMVLRLVAELARSGE